MDVMDIKALPASVRPMHREVYAREVFGPSNGGRAMTVLYSEMKATGGAEMHAHAASEHVFVVIEGELKVDNGRESRVVRAGEALILKPGEPHQVVGNGVVDCTYVVITCPPA